MGDANTTGVTDKPGKLRFSLVPDEFVEAIGWVALPEGTTDWCSCQAEMPGNGLPRYDG